MAKFLTIDLGNTTAKALVWDCGQPVGDPVWGRLTDVAIEQMCPPAGSFDCAAVCCVSADKRGLIPAAEQLSRRCIVVDSSTPTPVDISRYSSATLGPDRIAAMAGAMSLCPGQDLLVVDCGTAVTYDRVDRSGRFLGGNIAPGLGMRLKALHKFTAKLPLVDSDPQAPLWGCDTAQAMQAGALRGIVAEVVYYASQCPSSTAVVLTGGRAPALSPLLASVPHICDPLLVLRGLKTIIDYNENI